MRVSLLILVTCCVYYGSCVTLTEQNIRDAIQEAQDKVFGDNAKEDTVESNVDSQKANLQSQMGQMKGTVLMEATKILIAKYGIDVLPQMEAFDIDSMYGTTDTDETSARKKREYSPPTNSQGCQLESGNCQNQKYVEFRSITGICNNVVQNNKLGAAQTPLRRILGSASFADGIGSVRSKSVTGSALPSTRQVSNKLHAEGVTTIYDFETNHLHMQFGQFIAHDIIFMPSSVGKNGAALDCTACNSSSVSENCAPIPVPSDDTYFKPNSCIRLTRSLNGQKGLGQRQPINQNTHLVDLSVVYGSEECEAKNVRSFTGGELKTYNNGYVLPPQNKNDSNCQSGNPYYCFTAGDFRNSLHPGLIPLHVTFIKEHNRIARQFAAARKDWNDEKIFQETRRVVVAQYQHIVYNEYLPKLFGSKTTLLSDFDLVPQKTGYYYVFACWHSCFPDQGHFVAGYDNRRNPSLSYEFSAAAFRFGHSQARKDIPRLTNANTTKGSSVDLGANIFYADSLYDKNAGGTESMLEGMLQYPAMKVDKEFSFPIRNQLFEIRNKPASGVDLVSVNLMRGRDVGLYPYNQYRTLVGLKKANTFDDLKNEMTTANINALKTVYADVNDVDLYSGILLETPLDGAMLGRTGLYIIAETFSQLKRGDRFFYENEVVQTRKFTAPELVEIRKKTFAKVLCESSDTMFVVNSNAFNLKSARVGCDTLAELSITPFTQPPVIGPAGGPPPGVPPPPPPPTVPPRNRREDGGKGGRHGRK